MSVNQCAGETHKVSNLTVSDKTWGRLELSMPPMQGGTVNLTVHIITKYRDYAAVLQIQY